jgi:hypothetical protein
LKNFLKIFVKKSFFHIFAHEKKILFLTGPEDISIRVRETKLLLKKVHRTDLNPDPQLEKDTRFGRIKTMQIRTPASPRMLFIVDSTPSSTGS